MSKGPVSGLWAGFRRRGARFFMGLGAFAALQKIQGEVLVERLFSDPNLPF
jgi:hypothetical protein